MGHTDTSWPHQRWEFSQHPLAHQKLSLSRMWIQDKGAAETSTPISNTRNLKPSHIVCCIEAENEIASLRMATKYQSYSSSLQDVFIAKQKKDFIKQLQAEVEADKINVLVANLLASKPVGRPLKNAPAAVVLQSSAVLGPQRKPP